MFTYLDKVIGGTPIQFTSDTLPHLAAPTSDTTDTATVLLLCSYESI